MVDWLRRSFEGCRAFLASMHQKEKVIAPALRHGVGLQVSPCLNLDTDQFGTFSGERQRLGSAVDAARAKIAAGFVQKFGTIGLASEGSFGPDPSLPLVPIGREIVLFFDSETGLEVVGTSTDHQPRFDHVWVSNTPDAVAFAERIGFPDHGVIVSDHSEGSTLPERLLFKDIADLEALRTAVASVLKEFRTAFLQTDMRAHRNPTRMTAISTAAWDLARRLQSRCPSCHCPGYDITGWRPGRPCDWCGLATRIIEVEVLTCPYCGHNEERRAAGPDRIDPALCDHCNP